MPPKDGLRLNYLGRTKQARPEPCHPYQQCPVNPAQPKTRRRTPLGDVELMTEEKALGSSRHRGLNKSATNMPSARRIAIIVLNNAMILSYDTNPGRMKFSERTATLF